MVTPEQIASHLIPNNYWISNEKLIELLYLLFAMSLRKEESRYPKFQIFIPFKNEELPFPALLFKEPIKITEDILHRISSGIPQRPYGLCIYENDGQLFANGIFRFEYSGFSKDKNYGYKYTLSKTFRGLIIRIDDPGHFIIMHLALHGQVIYYEYKNGKLNQVFDFNMNPIILLDAQKISTIIASKYNLSANVTPIVRGLISEIISKVYSISHGSTILFLPCFDLDENIKNNLNIYIETVGPDFGKLIAEFVLISDTDIQTFFDKWSMSIDTVVNMSKVDGALIFNSELKLLGIRTVITSQTLSDDTPVYKALPNNAILKQDGSVDLDNFGTRHRSVANFCNSINGAIGIVISEDQEIRVFQKHDNAIYICGPLKILPGLSAH